MKRIALMLTIIGLVGGGEALARDRLGVWNTWGAFRDTGVPRCYAIAMAIDQRGQRRETQPFITIAHWPKRNIHGEVHVRLSRQSAQGRNVTFAIGGQKFSGIASGIDAWSADRRTDAALVAALRGSGDLTVTATARDGRPMRDVYHLAGAASAMDAASLGCAAS